MRAFIILGFLVAASTAGSLGYNYAPGNLQGSGSSLVGTVGLAGVGGLSGNRYGSGLISSGNGLIGTGNSRLISTGGYGGGLISSGGYGNGIISSGGYGNGLIGSGSLIGGSSLGGGRIISGGNGILNGGSQIISGGSRLIGGSGLIGGNTIIGGGSGLIGGGISSGATRVIGVDAALDSVPQTVEYSKQFFHYEAPEEIQEEGTITKQLSNVLKKNLQVVFIKAPENNAATSAALQLAKQAIEQKTDIYVLSKQNDGAQLVGQLQQIQESVPTVPEVRIVKYRTPQDLAIAKETIQAQYENTGGSTQTINGGVVPILNYASGIGSYSTGGALLGSNLGSTNIIGGGSLIGSGLGSGLGSTTIIDNGSLLGSGLGSSRIIGGGSLIGSGIGSTKIIGGGSLLGSGIGSGITTTKIIDGGSLIGSGNYALGSNRVSSISSPVTTQYLPPLKKK